MEIIPAIDVSKGKCVRLFKGLEGTEKVYYENPLDALDFWIKLGAKRLHFIDLDAAWGSDVNKVLLKNMIKKASSFLKVQVGGGIRTIDTAIDLIKLGADRIIIGTLAIQKPENIKILAEKIGSEKIIIALDYKEGKIATHGWKEQTNIDPFSFGKMISEYGAGFILFSSVEADGAFTGPDLRNIKRMINTVKMPVYAAGGIRNEQDINNLKKIGTHGVVIGKAFYEYRIPSSIIKNYK